MGCSFFYQNVDFGNAWQDLLLPINAHQFILGKALQVRHTLSKSVMSLDLKS
jgi:hypothetical protein